MLRRSVFISVYRKAALLLNYDFDRAGSTICFLITSHLTATVRFLSISPAKGWAERRTIKTQLLAKPRALLQGQRLANRQHD